MTETKNPMNMANIEKILLKDVEEWDDGDMENLVAYQRQLRSKFLSEEEVKERKKNKKKTIALDDVLQKEL